jgi:hypothetical protein
MEVTVTRFPLAIIAIVFVAAVCCRGVIGVQADVLYGSKPVEIVGKGTLKQSVMHVPVMLEVNLGQSSAHGFRVFLLGGGYIEWQFNGELQDVDVSGDTSGFEAGLTAGGGFEVLRLSVQARYARGLRGIDKTFNLSQTVEMKSNCFLLLFGIRLNWPGVATGHPRALPSCPPPTRNSIGRFRAVFL